MRSRTWQIGPVVISVFLLLASGCEPGGVPGEETFDGRSRQSYGPGPSLLRSIAVDSGLIPLGTTVWIKRWDGGQVPTADGIGGFVHDGRFRALRQVLRL